MFGGRRGDLFDALPPVPQVADRFHAGQNRNNCSFFREIRDRLGDRAILERCLLAGECRDRALVDRIRKKPDLPSEGVVVVVEGDAYRSLARN
jgi:hypothetical protein